MRRAARLQFLYLSAVKRLRRLAKRAALVARAAPMWATYQIEAEVSAVTIDALNTWTNASKWYFITCCLGAKSMSGRRISSSAATFLSDAGALGFAITEYRMRALPNSLGLWDRRDEPTWHDPNVLLHLCEAALLTNAADVSAAFSAGFRVFSDLPVFRNYFAHRNRETSEAVMRLAPMYGIGPLAKPSDVLRHVPVGSGTCVLETWLDELSLTLEYLCY